MNYADDVATGHGDRRLRIAGRPRQGQCEILVLAEEPGDPVLMHYRSKQVPHFRINCPHCLPTDEPVPYWYIGAVRGNEFVIVELTQKCFESASAAARQVSSKGATDLFGNPIDERRFKGLVVRIERADFARSPRVLRCEQRVDVSKIEWPYQTRHELARIWGVPVKPRIYREDRA